ncbi:reverse transcriptase domain, Reverse transcriptase zinc-binding domain protein [Artemisia annua]|uniref:Reverse transcriptase domain, Reverse transcriptase zinc-binding domain protein n=1 Tax=Artemisia annua TaxID=35608 RepID=A0A2U1P8W5_ARTAN|nr:reverse transcriptase domain, Reverse transcriptase zinc-binding domain protein [Artemisia annua]
MEAEHIQTNVSAKLPLLKQNEFDIWRLRVEQYFQVQDYALWEIIEDGNSFNPQPTTTTVNNEIVINNQTTPSTAEEKLISRSLIYLMILMMSYYGVISMVPFLVACAWDSLRARADQVDWFHIPWFPHCIPWHAVHLWLVIRRKLKTQDRLRESDVGPNVELSLLKH